jgi:hypothetical protein
MQDEKAEVSRAMNSTVAMQGVVVFDKKWVEHG